VKKITILLTAILFFTMAAIAFAEEDIGFIQRMKNKFMKKPVQSTAAAKVVPAPKGRVSPATEKILLKKEDVVDNIKQMLSSDPEVIPNIANLKMLKEKDKVSYTFKGAALESLDRESLQGLSDRILGEIGVLRSNAINEQMSVVRQSQQVQMQVNQAQQAQAASRQIAQAQAIPKAPPAAMGPPNIPNGGRGGATGGPGGPGGPSSVGGKR